MSLLLDALKKAAEQKAAKTRDEEPGSGAGLPEETVLEVSADDAPGDSADEDSLPRHRLEDETQLDQSELDTRLERLQRGREDGTETGLDVADATATRTPFAGQARSGEDETLIFSEDDVAEVMQDQSGLPRRAADDETDLSQLAGGEHDISMIQSRADTAVEDTELRQPQQPEDRADTRPPSGGDETDISLPPVRADALEPGEASQREARGEDNDSSAAPMTAEPAAREDVTGPSDDDMSLLLVEREPTQLTSPTDPQRPQDALQALKAGAPTAADVGLVDNTQNRLGEDRTANEAQTRTRSSNTATTGLATPTRVRPAPGSEDATGTHTYAPDNYDRTLMRLPNDDASKLFAGMKSDSEVVMTPDYAKQVFRSKSSAQRVQHYKFYGVIALVILLGIGVYGIFEYQAESEVIDSSLRPLKNDPMPGIIRSQTGEVKAEQLFGEAEVNERALEIIKNAEQDETASEQAEPVAEDAPAEHPEQDNAAAEAGEAESAVSGRAATGTAPMTQPKTAEARPAESQAAADSQASISGVIAGGGEHGTAGGATSNLRIQTSSRLEEKQKLLHEAYQAYQSGNDTLALQRYNQVLKIDPRNRNALLARAAIQIENGNSAAAIDDYQALLLANPKDSLAMASLLAVASYSPRETETRLKLMIRDEPDSPYLNFALANAYGAQNRWQEAQGHYYTALQNNPDDPNYAYNLAVSLEHISKPGAAVSYYRRALQNYHKGLATFSRDVVDSRLEKLAKQ
jgi:tetratricopeptide (TPR) repeat protein